MTAAAIAEVHKEKIITPPAKPEALPPLDANSASQNISVWLILRSPFNRKPEVDDDFVANIRENGVIQPIIVRRVKLGLDRINELPASTFCGAIGSMVYELVAGERRWLAAKKANRHSIPAVIRELTDVQAMKIQIAENEHRQDYSILDRSEAYARLRNEYMHQHKGEKGWTEEKCMDLIAVDCKNDKIKGRTVQQIIALGKLTMDCQAALRKGEIEASHGYELCRRSAEDQAELMLWLRQQTHHSQGDIPSVRRLKLETHKMDELREAEKRRQPLFAPPQPGTSTTKVPTVDDQLYAKALEVVREAKLHRMNDPLFLERNLKVEPAAASQIFARLEKEGIVTPRNAHSERSYIFPQTSAPETRTVRAGFAGTREVAAVKPPTETQIKRAQKERDEEQQRFIKQQAEHRRKARIEEQYRAGLFVALVSKAHVCSRLLTHVVPGLLLEMWNMDDLPVEKLGREILQWPEPRDGGDRYSQQEIEAHAKKHTRKFNGNLLAALCICLHLNQPQAEQLAKYFSIDPKKLRQKAAAAVKQEDAQAKLKAKGQGPKAGVRA